MSLFDKTLTPIGLACDHAGYHAKEYIKKLLIDKGIPFKDFGTKSEESTDYADYGHALATSVERGECYPGVAICGTGNGINMTLNKHMNVRSALCWNKEISFFARSHNDANILVLPGKYVSEEDIYDILVTFLNTSFEGGRHKRRIDKIPLK